MTKHFRKVAVAAVATVTLLHGEVFAGVYTGSTSTATFNSLLSQVQAKATALSNKVVEAQTAGVNTDYAKVSQVTVTLFKDIYAPYDRANSNAIVAEYNANTFISQNDPVGPIGLPFDELADCIELADAAIAELQAQIDGTLVRQAPPNFATGGVTLNGTHYQQSGKTVFPHYFFWHPFNEDIMQAYGRMGEGYLAITDMQNLSTAKSGRYTALTNLMTNQRLTNRAPNQFFLGHVDYGSSWHRTTYPDAFNVGKRLFTDYDIDHPQVPVWINYLFTNMLKGAVTACGTQERIHMLANEPVWSIRQGGVDANQSVSGYTFSKFATWLQGKYGTVGGLNSTYGTSFSNFNQAASAYYVTNSGVSASFQGGPVWYDWCRFNMSRVNAWFAFLNTAAKGIDPAGKTHIKVLGERSIHTPWHDEGIDFEFINNLVDMPGSDNQMTSRRAWESEYYQRLNAGDWYNRYNLEWREQSIMLDFVKSLNPEKPCYDSEWHGLSGSRWRDFHMEPAYVREALWLSFTHGLSAMNAWVWCRYDGTEGGTTNGQPRPGSDFFGESATQPLQLDAWGRTMKEINAHGDAVKSLVPTQRFYLLYYNQDAAIQDTNYTAQLKLAYESLKLLNVPVGFTTPTLLSTVTNPAQTLIISPTRFISNADLAALQSFVSGGGKTVLVGSNLSFVKTELGANRAGGAGFTPFASVATNTVNALADSLATALAARKPALPVSFDVRDTNGLAAYGVLCQQAATASPNAQTLSLINASHSPRRVTVQLQAGGGIALSNLVTGQLMTTNSLLLQPCDVLLLRAVGTLGNPLWDAFVSQYALSGVKTNNADGDRLNDWGEYVFGGNPTNAFDVGVVPVFSAPGGGYTFQLRNDTNLTAYVLTKTNLTDPTWSTNQTVNVTNNNGAMGVHILTLDTSGDRLFMMLMVVEGAQSAPVPPYQIIIGADSGTNGVPSSGNGNFEAYAGPTLPPGKTNTWAISQMPHWHNLSGAETQTCGTDQGMVGSPEPNSYGAYLYPTFTVANDTGYTITAAGETFDVSMAVHKYGSAGNYNNDEAVVVKLFTSTTGVTDGTVLGDITELASISFPVTGSWVPASAPAFYTSAAADIGKTVYLGITLTNPTGNDVFPRIDVVRLEANK